MQIALAGLVNVYSFYIQGSVLTSAIVASRGHLLCRLGFDSRCLIET